MTAKQQQQDDLPLYDIGDDDDNNESQELFGFHLTQPLDYIGIDQE